MIVPSYDERFQVRKPEIEQALRAMAALLDDEVPAGWGWGLFLVPFGENEAAPKGDGSVFWISNSERAGMIAAVQGWIDDNKKRLTGAPTP